MEQVNIPKVYSVLLRLERVIEREKELLSGRKVGDISRYHLLRAHRELAESMRKTANRLQLHCAAGNTGAAFHEIRLFEGLAAMIEPAIVPQLLEHNTAIEHAQTEYH